MKFIKEPEVNDKNRIEFSSVALTTTDILEDFKCFLMACGYPIDFSDQLVIVKENEDD